MDAHDGTTFNYALLPAELLQVVGSQLCSRDLRHARLVCVAWATALAHSMPAVTVALPRQASERIFRQPLVLCSSGVLNSAQSRDYSAIPRQAPAHAPALGRRRSCRHSHDGSSSGSPGCSGACKRACTGSGCSGAHRLAAARRQTEPGVGPAAAPPPQQQVEEAATCSSLAAAEVAAVAEAQQPVSRDKPSPFATEMGQAVLDCLLEDPLLAAGSKQVSCSTATAARAAAGTSTATNNIPKLPRVSAIKAAISMPPTLAEQAAATQQQQAMQPDGQHMRKLSSLPASSGRPMPRTRHVSKPAASEQQQQQPQAPPAGPHHVVTTPGPAIQGWSSLPSAGLRTCSSLKQLHLKLSGAPPSPDDLLDLSKLLHLTHLSFKQVDEPDQQDLQHTALQEDSTELHCSSSSEPGHACLNAPPAPAAASTAVCSKDGHCAAGPSGVKRSHSTGPVRLQASVGGLCSDVDAATAAAACALEGCHIHGMSPAACMQQLDDMPVNGWAAGQACASNHLACSSSEEVTCDACMLGGASDWQQDGADDSGGGAAATAAAGEGLEEEEEEEGCVLGSDGRMSAQSISCSVITPEHVAALAQLPHLSSLELAPKAGMWDAVSREGLLHLVKLTGLTRLSITWGDAAAATAPLSNEDAAAAAQGEQLPLQKCLAGLTSLQELCINGAAVVDVAVLQQLQQLRCLTAEGLQVVHSDVMALIAEAEQQQQREQQQQAEANQQQEGSAHGAQPVLSAAAAAPAGPQQGAAAGGSGVQGGGWASLPCLQYVHAVHPVSDISLLLQSTVTPQLSHLGFVTRGPSDFARLLGQHGKLRTLHLAFTEEEPWHPIAVVRLPTALPSLRSLTIDGGFWLPNSLIVALGVMDVPLEHLSLTCRLAPPCLQRLQHLKQLKRLALHHVPPAAGSGANSAMLQLPAKLLPPQLQELEISNGWILH